MVFPYFRTELEVVLQLLIFAHRGEAQTFLSQLKVTADKQVQDLYLSDDFFILITGEGIQNASIKTASVLTSYSNKINEVINFGIAGALSKKLEINTVYEIRTAYAEQRSSKVEFKSFSSNSGSKIDCISSIDRTLSDDQSNYLSNFAKIVDRELWGIAYASKYLSKPFRSFKLISDYAGTDVSCFDIKHKAAEYSETLYTVFMNLSSQIKKPKFSIDLPEAFYLTVSHERVLYSLIQRLSIKINKSEAEILKSNLVSNLVTEDISPKKRTSRLIQELTNLLNPFRQKLDENLKDIFTPLTDNGIQIAIDKDMETNEFKIQASIQNEKQLDRIKSAINNFDYQRFKNLLNGIN